MGEVIFITGGARSGKSTFALELASKSNAKKAFIATCEPLDDEMKARIEHHRAERGPGWETFEEPLEVPRLLGTLDGHGVVLIDCLTLWLSNLTEQGLDVQEYSDALITGLKALIEREGDVTAIVVTNELGMGIVPDNEAVRSFRDLMGRLNQKVAEMADTVYLTVSGIPVKIKG